MRSIPSRLPLALLLALSCTPPAPPASDGGDTPDGGADAGVDGAEPDLGGGEAGPIFDESHGTVVVARVQSPYGAQGMVSAAFYKEPSPGFHREVMRAGACRLLTFKSAFCNTPCQGVCVDIDVCKPFPRRLSAGALSFTGLKVPLTVQPGDFNFYTSATRLPEDLFDGGAALTVTAGGQEFSGFRADVPGVAPLRTTAIVKDEITLKDDADYTFTWTPGPDPMARLRLTINANNRGHGHPYEAIIECDSPDSGGLTIPRSFIAAFPRTFRWEICAGQDCPLSWVRRYRRSVITTPSGKVAFDAASEQSFFVLHNAPQR